MWRGETEVGLEAEERHEGRGLAGGKAEETNLQFSKLRS